jgi:hypothetical protein
MNTGAIEPKPLQGIQSPIALLPPELLGEIFLHIFEGTSSDFPEPFTDRSVPVSLCPNKPGPWLLGRVCSLWRDTSISLPTLWTNILVDGADIGPHSADIVQTILTRTGSLPLQIAIVLEPFVEDDVPLDPLHDTMECLVSQTHRWQDVSLNIHAAFQSLDRLLERETNSWSALRSLELIGMERALSSGDGANLGINANFANSAKNLIRVSLTFRRASTFPTNLKTSLPWNQIKHLKMDMNDTLTKSLFLQQCLSQLVTLDLSTYMVTQQELLGVQGGTERNIALSRLRRLKINGRQVYSVLCIYLCWKSWMWHSSRLH